MKNKGFAATRSTLIYVTVIMMLFSFPYWWKTIELQDDDVLLTFKFYWIIILWFGIACTYALTYWLIDIYKRKQIKWLDRIHVWLSAMSYTVVFFLLIKIYGAQLINSYENPTDMNNSANVTADIITNTKVFLFIFIIAQLLFFINIGVAISKSQNASPAFKEDIDHLIT